MGIRRRRGPEPGLGQCYSRAGAIMAASEPAGSATMAASEQTTEMTPREYLAGADREWAAGNHQEAAGLLWKATKSTFIQLAEERGLEYDEYLIGLAKALEADGAVYEWYYRGNLGVAKLMRDHAEMDVLEGYQLESTFDLVRRFLVEQHGEPH